MTNYNRLNREGNIPQNQQIPYDYQMQMQQQQQQQIPNNMNFSSPQNFMPPPLHENRTYIDTQANSKYYYPQDYQPQYSGSPQRNKPVSELPGQTNSFPSQFDRSGPGLGLGFGGINDPYGAGAYNVKTIEKEFIKYSNFIVAIWSRTRRTSSTI